MKKILSLVVVVAATVALFWCTAKVIRYVYEPVYEVVTARPQAGVWFEINPMNIFGTYDTYRDVCKLKCSGPADLKVRTRWQTCDSKDWRKAFCEYRFYCKCKRQYNNKNKKRG